jgi:hypothetical protein
VILPAAAVENGVRLRGGPLRRRLRAAGATAALLALLALILSVPARARHGTRPA